MTKNVSCSNTTRSASNEKDSVEDLQSVVLLQLMVLVIFLTPRDFKGYGKTLHLGTFYDLLSKFRPQTVSCSNTTLQSGSDELMNTEERDEAVRRAACSVTTTDGLGRICLTNRKKCSNMQCFAIPFKPLGPKMAKTVSYSNTTQDERFLLFRGRAVHEAEGREAARSLEARRDH